MKQLMRSLTWTFALMLALASAAWSGELPDFTQIIERNSGAVVKILSTQTARAGQDMPGGIDPRDLEQMPEIFRRLFEQQQRGRSAPERQSMGSGFIISPDGYIMTNHHVIDGADKVVVRLADRREFDAEVVGSDKRSDIALLKVKAGGLPTVTFGDSNALKVGEWVVAIGSPFGLDYSVSQGIVSARGRSLPNEENDNYVPFIQTDVAINPGNSGGPLFNLKGEVVGVNSQIYTRTGGSIGLSFAIPIAVASDVVQQLKASGHVVRGWLGVSIQDVDRDLAESFKLERPMGALIAQLEPGGPAEKGGIQAGDVVVAFNGETINESADLPHVVGLIRPDTRVPVKVIRGGKPIELTVKVGALDGGDRKTLAQAGGDTGGRFGAIVEDLPDELKARLRLGAGVVLREIAGDGAAARAGLEPGDIIAQVGNTPVKDAASFERLIESLPANTHIPVRLIRRGPQGMLFTWLTIRFED